MADYDLGTGRGLHYMGVVENYNALPDTAKTGAWYVTTHNVMWVWEGAAWQIAGRYNQYTWGARYKAGIASDQYYFNQITKGKKSSAAKRYEREVKEGKKLSRRDPPPAPADGLKVILTGIGNGLTVDQNGRALLPQAFVFQCSPLEQYTLAHTFNFGTYDTVDDDQFARRGSRQLSTWQFDTMVMYLGATAHDKHYLPGWVPYPIKEPGGQQMQRPEWYVDQLRNLFVAGAPFRYVATFKGSTTIHRTYAVLTAFNEDYRHGEGDAIYLSAVSFMEWRDPRGTPPRHGARLPAHIRFRETGGRYLAYDVKTNRMVKTRSKTNGTTFMDLARDFYGDAGDWRTIAKANKCHGGSGSLPIFKQWFPHRLARGKPNVTVVVPTSPSRKPAERRTAQKKG
jgi:hypothetical protein